MTRLFFVADVHAADAVFKKTLNAAMKYKADVIIIGGDLTGKAIVPIVNQGNGWYVKALGQELHLNTRQEVEAVTKELSSRGYYVKEMTKSEVDEFMNDKKKMDELFKTLALQKIEEWIEIIRERVPENVKVVMLPGNDDVFEVDRVIEESGRVIFPEGKLVELDDRYRMISCSWSTPSPWNTHRECSEEEMRAMLEREFRRTDDYDHLVCNFHEPPYDTVLDRAPKLDENLKPVTKWGMVVMTHVGGRAVRELILRYQPLLSLHGHIHESPGHMKLGRTLCLNPGSEYQQGILRGYFIDLPREGEKLDFWRIDA